jgi:hypothetical protein
LSGEIVFRKPKLQEEQAEVGGEKVPFYGNRGKARMRLPSLSPKE